MLVSIEDIRRRSAPVLRQHGVTRAVLVGSVARGTAHKSSDIDLVVEFNGDRGLRDLVGLKLDLEAVLGRTVDVTTYKALYPPLADEMLREQVTVL